MDWNTRWELIFVLIVAIIGAVACVFLFNYITDLINLPYSSKYIIDRSWLTTTGELVELDHGGSGGASKFSYWYNFKHYEEYSEIDLYVPGNVRGEKYLLLLNPNIPNRYVPIKHKPVFSDNEVTAMTTGKITYISPAYDPFSNDDSTFLISFSYDIGENRYERGQIFLREYRSIFHIDSLFKIQYLVIDPRRAILYIDQHKDRN